MKEEYLSLLARTIAPYAKAMEEFSRSPEAQRMMRQIKSMEQAFRRTIAPHIKAMEEFSRRPEIRLWMSINRAGSLLHPIYSDLFEPDFVVEDIKPKWARIRAKLWSRRPKELMNDHREERYKQILKCQTIGAYIPVCRSAYSEIESLLRDEFFLADSSWIEEFNEKDTANKRRQFQSQELRRLVKNEHPTKALIESDQTLSEVGMFTTSFLCHLDEMFESFDPKHSDDPTVRSHRHVHAHGWKKQATFIDGLNALLALDLALDVVALKKKEERNTDKNRGES